MMDWNRLRQTWQHDECALSEADVLAAVQQRDGDLRAKLRRRDWLESIVGLLIAPVFAVATWRAGVRGDWLPAFFAAFLGLWACYVPLHLWRTRRRLPKPHWDRPLLAFLREEHAAMVAQAQQLERIWVWYLAPCAFGVIGLNFAARGPTTGTWIYAAIVLAFCAVLARANHYAARSQFRDHAQRIAQQISRLTEENQR